MPVRRVRLDDDDETGYSIGVEHTPEGTSDAEPAPSLEEELRADAEDKQRREEEEVEENGGEWCPPEERAMAPAPRPRPRRKQQETPKPVPDHVRAGLEQLNKTESRPSGSIVYSDQAEAQAARAAIEEGFGEGVGGDDGGAGAWVGWGKSAVFGKDHNEVSPASVKGRKKNNEWLRENDQRNHPDGVRAEVERRLEAHGHSPEEVRKVLFLPGKPDRRRLKLRRDVRDALQPMYQDGVDRTWLAQALGCSRPALYRLMDA